MAIDTKENIRFLASVITALMLMVLVPLNGWHLTQTISHSDRITKVETRMGEGARYTADDAEKDQGLLAKILDDHEIRLRALEKNGY